MLTSVHFTPSLAHVKAFASIYTASRDGSDPIPRISFIQIFHLIKKKKNLLKGKGIQFDLVNQKKNGTEFFFLDLDMIAHK